MGKRVTPARKSKYGKTPILWLGMELTPTAAQIIFFLALLLFVGMLVWLVFLLLSIITLFSTIGYLNQSETQINTTVYFLPYLFMFIVDLGLLIFAWWTMRKMRGE